MDSFLTVREHIHRIRLLFTVHIPIHEMNRRYNILFQKPREYDDEELLHYFYGFLCDYNDEEMDYDSQAIREKDEKISISTLDRLDKKKLIEACIFLARTFRERDEFTHSNLPNWFKQVDESCDLEYVLLQLFFSMTEKRSEHKYTVVEHQHKLHLELEEKLDREASALKHQMEKNTFAIIAIQLICAAYIRAYSCDFWRDS